MKTAPSPNSFYKEKTIEHRDIKEFNEGLTKRLPEKEVQQRSFRHKHNEINIRSKDSGLKS